MKAKEIHYKSIKRNIIHLEGMFWINYDCIFTQNKLVYPLRKYELLDFLDDGELHLWNVQFYHANLKGSWLTIILRDSETGKLLHRKHNVSDLKNQVCNWLLIEPDYFDPKTATDEKVIHDYCNSKS